MALIFTVGFLFLGWLTLVYYYNLTASAICPSRSCHVPRVREINRALGDLSRSRPGAKKHHFEHEPPPSRAMDPEFVALHERIAERNAAILYRGTGVKSFNQARA